MSNVYCKQTKILERDLLPLLPLLPGTNDTPARTTLVVMTMTVMLMTTMTMINS